MGYWDTIKAWAKKAYFTLLAWAKAAYYTLFEKHLSWTLLFSAFCAICACAFGIGISHLSPTAATKPC